MIANKMCFSKTYSDESGVEFAVGLQSDAIGREILLEHVNNVDFPLVLLDWLIECLQRIKEEVKDNECSMKEQQMRDGDVVLVRLGGEDHDV